MPVRHGVSVVDGEKKFQCGISGTVGQVIINEATDEHIRNEAGFTVYLVS